MKNILPAFLLMLPLLWACSIQEPENAGQLSGPADSSHIIPGSAVVLLDEDAVATFPEDILAGGGGPLGIHAVERVFPDAGEFEERHRAAGLHRWYRVRFDTSVPATKAQADLSGLPGVQAVELPRRKKARGFNDPGLRYQWNYINNGKNPETGATGGPFVKGVDINVEPVWEQFTTGSSEVIVAVIDSGIDMTHPDLRDVTIPGGENGSRNFIEGYDPKNIVSGDHGTHVAGTIGAANNNEYGVVGIAGGEDGRGGVQLLSCVIFADSGDDSLQGDDALALVWAADHGAVIANNSWGYEFDSAKMAELGARNFLDKPSSTKTAIDYFIDHAGTDAQGNQTGPMKGGVVFFAAGNEGWAHDAPAEYERVVAVGAVGPDGSMPLFSNYGPWVDLLAPGGSDADEDHYEEWILSTGLEESFYYMAGTSMACPHAAGVAALLVSYYGGPGFTNEDLKERLLGGTRTDYTLPAGRTVGGGMLDAYGAFEYNLNPDNPDLDDIRITTDYSGDYRIKSHETLDVNYKISGNDRGALSVRFQSDCPGATAVCTKSSVRMMINALEADPGDYTAHIRISGTVMHDIAFTILENHAPQLTAAFDNQIVNAASAAPLNIELDGHFQDPDGETLKFSASLSDSQVASAILSGSRLTLSPSDYGQTDVTITATDARGEKCSTRFSLLARNDYQALDIFPNPVTDFLRIRPATDCETAVTLYSRSGSVVFSQTTAAGPFNPLIIDVKDLSPGTYTLQVEFDGKQQTKNIVKY